MATTKTLTLAEITRRVADEWAKQGKLTVPPDSDATSDDAFWTEVRKRYDGQSSGA